MNAGTIIEKIKEFIAGKAFKLFLWGNNLTAEEYWKQIYEQEQGDKPEQRGEESRHNLVG